MKASYRAAKGKKLFAIIRESDRRDFERGMEMAVANGWTEQGPLQIIPVRRWLREPTLIYVQMLVREDYQ